MPDKTAVPAAHRNLWPLPATTVMVSCVGHESRPNIITIGACGIASARPPLISLAFGVNQYSLQLIRETGDFCVNVPSKDQAKITDWCGTVSGRRVDKFAEGRLTPVDSLKVTSPHVGECPVSYECTLWKIVNCGSHDLVLGEIVQVHVATAALDDTGEALDPHKFNPLVSLQLTYFGLGDAVGHWPFARGWTPS